MTRQPEMARPLDLRVRLALDCHPAIRWPPSSDGHLRSIAHMGQMPFAVKAKREVGRSSCREEAT